MRRPLLAVLALVLAAILYAAWRPFEPTGSAQGVPVPSAPAAPETRLVAGVRLRLTQVSYVVPSGSKYVGRELSDAGVEEAPQALAAAPGNGGS